MRVLRAELSKLVSLPFAWLACAAGIALPVGIAVIAGLTQSPGRDTGFSELAVGVAGAIVLGVTAMGSEYVTEGEESAGGRQVLTTLTATPSRIAVLTAKVVAVAIATAALAVVAFALVTLTTRILLGDAAPALGGENLARLCGALVYWVLMALLAFGLTVLTRNGILPMTVLVANSSAVTVTYLIAQNVPAANWLPDLAGMRMFTTVRTGTEIDPLLGGLVMAGWVAAVLVAAAIVFRGRDA